MLRLFIWQKCDLQDYMPPSPPPPPTPTPPPKKQLNPSFQDIRIGFMMPRKIKPKKCFLQTGFPIASYCFQSSKWATRSPCTIQLEILMNNKFPAARSDNRRSNTEISPLQNIKCNDFADAQGGPSFRCSNSEKSDQPAHPYINDIRYIVIYVLTG